MSPQEIISWCCMEFGVPEHVLRSPRRFHRAVDARRLATMMIREECGYSYPDLIVAIRGNIAMPRRQSAHSSAIDWVSGADKLMSESSARGDRFRLAVSKLDAVIQRRKEANDNSASPSNR